MSGGGNGGGRASGQDGLADLVTGDRLWTAISTVTIFGLWWLGHVFFPETIPGLVATGAALAEIVTTPGPYDHAFYFHVWKTSEMILVSIVVSLILGTLIGVTMGRVDPVEGVMSSWIYTWLAVPSLVIVFLSGIWLGYGAEAGYFAVPLVITPFVTLNMWEGAKNLDTGLNEMARFFGAGRKQTFFDVIIPQLVPYLIASVRSALSIGWKITLLVEAFILNRGVGFMFKWYFDQFNLTFMVSWIIIFVILLVIVEYGVIVPMRDRLTHWRPEAGGTIMTE